MGRHGPPCHVGATTSAARTAYPPNQFGARGRSAACSSFASLRTGLRGQMSLQPALAVNAIGRPAATGGRRPSSPDFNRWDGRDAGRGHRETP